MRDKRGAFSSIPEDQGYTEMLNAGACLGGYIRSIVHRRAERARPEQCGTQEIQNDLNQDHQGVDV